MSKALELTLSIGNRMVGSYSRPNKFITWYCDKRNLGGAWLTAPWCAMFASYLLKSAGVKSAGEYAYCPSWVNHFKEEKRWGTTPKVGAVAFYDWNGDGEADHVGIVTDVRTKVHVLEGNTRVGTSTNRVAVQQRSRSAVMGYGYPDYGSSPIVKTYVVKKGDTLSGIAKTLGLDWQKLYDANKGVVGKDPSLIKAGMPLSIP